MNTPNKLTTLRMLLIPVYIVFALYPITEYSNYIALFIFLFASMTDWLDGYLARKNNEVTNFGKIMDPLADKMLTTAALVCLIPLGRVSPWVVVIILAREFLVMGVRVASAAEGTVIAASIWGKIKTMWQMFAIVLALIPFISNLVVDIAMWIGAILTIFSGVDYLVKNMKHLTMK